MTVRGLIVALALLATTLCPLHTASAEPIPLTPNELVLNFDFSGQSPAAPYTFVFLFVTLESLPSSDTVFLNVYEDLDGAGSIVFDAAIGGSGAFTDFQASRTDAALVDGMFSIGLGISVLGLNTAKLFDAFALASIQTDGLGTLAFADGTLSTAQVPEPTSLILLGLGLVMLPVWRRTSVDTQNRP